ncbi:MAG: hypothetical protein ACFFC3_09585 [Candidatus Odinarchaeota archaeon]
MHEVTSEEEIIQIKMKAPHVVILGAGASRAACPNGDVNGKKLPIMNDFIQNIGLKELEDLGFDNNTNFEVVYSYLCDNKEFDKIRSNIEQKIYDYFEKIEMSDSPNLYDYLILSLRKKDVIATFNWDPLLIQAAWKNRNFDLPNLLFLHGNVGIGYCKDCIKTTLKQFPCNSCGKKLEPAPLLYPIIKKDYFTNDFVRSQWKTLQKYIKSAFWITIFGYSAPKYDTGAIELMKLAWGQINERNMEQIEIIDIKNQEELRETWTDFIFSHHWEAHNNFFDSWIANHPRRTGEAYLNQYLEAKFIDNNPIPRGVSFPELQKFFQTLQEVERHITLKLEK